MVSEKENTLINPDDSFPCVCVFVIECIGARSAATSVSRAAPGECTGPAGRTHSLRRSEQAAGRRHTTGKAEGTDITPFCIRSVGVRP